METILLILFLVVAALAFVVVEICTPTFGILGVLSVAAMIWAVWLCYQLGQVVGLVATPIAVVGYPAFILFAVKKIPQTAMGRWLMLRRDRSTAGEGTPEAPRLRQYVGRETTADTVLRPTGTVKIDGERIVARAEQGMISAGTAVRVIRATGTEVVVRPVEPAS